MSFATPRRKAIPSRLSGDCFRNERGSISASLIILPLVIFAILMAAHMALVLHARNVATAAAQDGLHAAQPEGRTRGDGETAALGTLDHFGGFDSRSARVTKTDDLVTVTVTTTVSTPLPGLFDNFSVQLSGPTERFYLETERQ